jgi:hypothetical protein
MGFRKGLWVGVRGDRDLRVIGPVAVFLLAKEIQTISGCQLLSDICPAWISESETSHPASWTSLTVVGTRVRLSPMLTWILVEEPPVASRMFLQPLIDSDRAPASPYCALRSWHDGIGDIFSGNEITFPLGHGCHTYT